MLHLSPFTNKDFDRLISWIETEKELVQFAGSLFTFPLSVEQLDAYVQSEKLKPYTITETQTGIIIGHCELNFSNKIPRLSRILIGDKAFRGKGLSKYIVSAMMEEIQKIKPTTLIDLNVFDWNLVAIKSYQNLGFKVQSESNFKFHEETWKLFNMVWEI